LGRARHLVGRAMRQHDTEAVGADAADGIALAQQAIEPLSDLDQDRIARAMAVGAVDDRKLVGADDEIGAGRAVAPVVGERMLEQVAQAYLVEVAGEVVEAGQMLEARLVLLARGDQAQAADDALGRAVEGKDRSTAVMNPTELAVLDAKAI